MNRHFSKENIQTFEKMFKITNYQRDANKNHHVIFTFVGMVINKSTKC